MSQINFRIENGEEEFISLMSKLENKSKSSISKEIFLKGLTAVMFPYLAQLYKAGKISIRKIAQITHLHPSEVISCIAELIEDIDLESNLIEYSEKVAEELSPFLEAARKKDFSLEGTINTNDEEPQAKLNEDEMKKTK